MNNLFPISFDFNTVMSFAASQDFSGTLYPGQPYQYTTPTGGPTDQASMTALVVWADDRVMPTWASITTGDIWTGYEAYYISQPAYRTDVDFVATNAADEFTTDEAIATSLATTVTGKVDKVSGKGLSSVDYTSADDTKLASLAVQINSDWNATTGLGKINNKPPIPIVQAYEGAVQRLNIIPYFGHATVASGVAVFNITSDGTGTGTALFPNGGIMDSVNVFVSDATASYQMSAAWSNSNKTVTVTTNKLTTANILTGLLGQAAANGAVVKISVLGY